MNLQETLCQTDAGDHTAPQEFSSVWTQNLSLAIMRAKRSGAGGCSPLKLEIIWIWRLLIPKESTPKCVKALRADALYFHGTVLLSLWPVLNPDAFPLLLLLSCSLSMPPPHSCSCFSQNVPQRQLFSWNVNFKCMNLFCVLSLICI